MNPTSIVFEVTFLGADSTIYTNTTNSVVYLTNATGKDMQMTIPRKLSITTPPPYSHQVKHSDAYNLSLFIFFALLITCTVKLLLKKL